jgi:hypothetical protein
MKAKAATRNLKELTIGPVITQTTEQMLGHVQNLCVVQRVPSCSSCTC